MCVCACLSICGLGMWTDSTTPLFLAALPGWPGAGEERGRGTAITTIYLGSYSGPTRVLPTDRYYLACLKWLALWPSQCDTGGLPSWLHPASSRAQLLPSGQTTWYAALSGLDGPFYTTARLTLFCWTATSVVTQTPMLITQSYTHWPLSVRPSYARSLVP